MKPAFQPIQDALTIELHCHSTRSDGALSPERMADRLHDSGVAYAALTDHDTLEGQRSFMQACKRIGIGVVTGIELTALEENQIVHLLGYGFSLDNPKLIEALSELHPNRLAPASVYANLQRLTAKEAIDLIHQAGGITLLAHPLKSFPDRENLSRILLKLKQHGLEGLEAGRPDESPEESAHLRNQARQLKLIVSAGTDYHATESDITRQPGLPVAREEWETIRNAILNAASHSGGNSGRAEKMPPTGKAVAGQSDRSYIRQIVLPAILALALFAGVIFLAVIPSFESALLDRKREMIRELTNTAWSVLAEAEAEHQQGLLTSDQARTEAIRRIASMRYGPEGKDYFWLQDTTPNMIMHPYRKDLEGKDLSHFTDPSGAAIFVLFARLVKEKNEGYVNYVWQWKDDARRLEHKESYIRLFEPWGWIIGTGLYTQDVREETARLKNRLLIFSFVIFVAVTFLLLIIIRAGLRAEKMRSQAEDLLLESTRRYKILVDAATEGMILVRNSTQLGYANPMALELIGISPEGVSLLELSDILPVIPENKSLHETLKTIDKNFPGEDFSCLIRRHDSTLIECTLTLQSTGASSAEGFLILLRRAQTRNQDNTRTSGILAKLLRLPSSIAQDLREEITRAETKEDITALCLSAPALVQSLLDNGASAVEIARMLSSVTDAATCRLIALFETVHGAAPLPFAFIALGSQGRMEQTLFTDQDNAILIAPTEDTRLAESANRYCVGLASYVCSALIDSGYRRCKGAAMADNPRWCRPLNDWKEIFNDWILKADIKELMEFSIFFDLRPVHGDASLCTALREHIHYRAGHAARFLPQMAQNALQFKPPLRLFGMVVPPQGKGDSTRLLDLKAASMPFTGFARLYALQSGLSLTHTIERMTELTRLGILLPSKLEEFSTAYTLLLRLRLRHQASIMQAGNTPDNRVNFSSLSHIEQAVLRECFNEIDTLQLRIRRDFLGNE